MYTDTDYPRLNEPQFKQLIDEFLHTINQVRSKDVPVADRQTLLLYKLERHMKAQESELKIMDRRNRYGEEIS